MTLAPESSGRANSSPLMNWLLMFPASVYSPADSAPRTVIPSASCAKPRPRSANIRAYTPCGRSISRPRPVKRTGASVREKSGMRNRSVLPLSQQSTGPDTGAKGRPPVPFRIKEPGPETVRSPLQWA